MEPGITAVVTAHDAGAALVERVRALVADPSITAVLLMDSGSTDGSIEAVAAALPGVVIRRFADNPGPCVTRNAGLAAAATGLVLLVDDDMRLDPGCLPALVAALGADPERVAAGPRILHEGSEDAVQYEGGWWHFAGLPHMRGQDGRALPERGPVEVDVLTSGCLLVRRGDVRDAGAFDPELFFLMEDVDLCMRLRWLGHRLVAVPAARAWNEGGSEGLSLRRDRYPARRTRLHARNRLLLLLFLYDLQSLIVLAPALLIMDLAWAAFSLLGGQLGAFVSGRVAVVRALGAVRRRRRAFLPRKRVRDRELLRAPPLTFTEAARARPLARRLSVVLDGVLRCYWTVARGALP